MSPEPENRTPPRRPPRTPLRRPISPIWFMAALFGALVVLNIVTGVVRQGKAIDYSDFKSLLAQGQVASVELAKDTITGTYTGGDGAPVTFNSARPTEDPDLIMWIGFS